MYEEKVIKIKATLITYSIYPLLTNMDSENLFIQCGMSVATEKTKKLNIDFLAV